MSGTFIRPKPSEIRFSEYGFDYIPEEPIAVDGEITLMVTAGKKITQVRVYYEALARTPGADVQTAPEQ